MMPPGLYCLAQQNMSVVGVLVRVCCPGAITTLGRGGSDLSATVLGAGLELSEVQVWKDVDGEWRARCRESRLGGKFLGAEKAADRERQARVGQASRPQANPSCMPAAPHLHCVCWLIVHSQGVCAQPQRCAPSLSGVHPPSLKRCGTEGAGGSVGAGS